MYRQEDIYKIEKNLSRLENEAEKIYKDTYYEPTIEEQKKVYEIIKEFIKEKKRIIYGGYAQNSLIEKKK